jgi:hypothetical protein
MNPLKSIAFRLSVVSTLAALLVTAQVPASDPVASPGGGLVSTNLPVTPALPVVAPPLSAENPISAPTGELVSPPGTAEAPKTAAPPKPAAPKLPGIGVRGTVKAVDPKAMTVTVTVKGKDKSTEHVVQISSSSRYTRDGKAAIVSELAVGDSFNGRVKKKKSEEVLITGAFKSAAAGSNATPKAKAKDGSAAASPSTPKQP